MFNLSLTGISYLAFVILFVFAYYLIKKQYRWCVLLLASGVFFYVVSGIKSVVWLVLGAIVTYLGALAIEKCEAQKKKKAIVVSVVLFMIAQLYLLKYTKGLPLVAPIAISFYTLSVIGYVLDVYWEISKAEKNPFMHLLYVCYFPQMTSGPVTRYRELKPQFAAGSDFDYNRVKNGLLRIVYGMMKKIIIADQVAVAVNTVFGDTITYQGAYVLYGSILFALQLYCDFSGCMDIVLGTSECFGIVLPENFEIPFTSVTMSEFWRRWHITLGVWFKEYVMYPMQKSGPFQKMNQFFVGKYGRKKGKKYPTYIGLFVVWFLIGYWHGGAVHYIIGSGILHWFYIVAGEQLEPFIKKITDKYNIDRTKKGYVLLRRLKVFLLVISGFVFFRAENTYLAAKMLYRMVIPYERGFFEGFDVLALGLQIHHYVFVMVGFLVVMLVSYYKSRGKNIRECLMKQNVLVRYTVYVLLILFVMVGMMNSYGADVSYFIYNQF